MSKHCNIRKAIAATAVSAALALTALSAGTASADTGTLEVGHWMGLGHTPAAPAHRTTDVTMKRAVVGDGTSNTVMVAEVPASNKPVPRYYLENAWPPK